MTTNSTLPQIIAAIGERDFAAIVANALCERLEFDLTAVIMHRPEARPAVLFDNFELADGRRAIDNYLRFTYRMNPMLARMPVTGVRRARDFAIDGLETRATLSEHLLLEADEELGFRTVGWPPRLEEIGLYFEACGGVVELGLYRERGRTAAPASSVRALSALREPIAAAFERHGTLGAKQARPAAASVLSPREREVCDLLLRGCSSEAIALRLDISRHTVKDHRKQIFRKLRVASLAELFAWSRPGH